MRAALGNVLLRNSAKFLSAIAHSHTPIIRSGSIYPIAKNGSVRMFKFQTTFPSGMSAMWFSCERSGLLLYVVGKIEEKICSVRHHLVHYPWEGY